MDIEKIILTKGRLLVEPMEMTRNQVLDVNEVREISMARVVAAGPLDEEFEGLEVGSVIVYERLNSEPVRMLDKTGSEVMLRFVLTRDVAAYFLKDGM